MLTGIDFSECMIFAGIASAWVIFMLFDRGL
jgi:hypothetical protein